MLLIKKKKKNSFYIYTLQNKQLTETDNSLSYTIIALIYRYTRVLLYPKIPTDPAY